MSPWGLELGEHFMTFLTWLYFPLRNDDEVESQCEKTLFDAYWNWPTDHCAFLDLYLKMRCPFNNVPEQESALPNEVKLWTSEWLCDTGAIPLTT